MHFLQVVFGPADKESWKITASGADAVLQVVVGPANKGADAAWLSVSGCLGGPAKSCPIVVHLWSSLSECGPQTQSAKSTKHDYTAIKVDHYEFWEGLT